MHTQVEGAFVDEVTPSLTNMRELAPQKSDIPILLCIQSIKVEYAKEYIIVEPMDSRRLKLEAGKKTTPEICQL
jgi:hypothetical protein